MENNNNEENRLRINGSNIENSINRSAVKSNQGKLALILGDSMVKDVDGYLLTGFINRISSAKTIDMEDYTKPTKRDLTNNFSLDDTPEVMSSRIIDTAKSLIIEKNNELLQTWNDHWNYHKFWYIFNFGIKNRCNFPYYAI